MTANYRCMSTKCGRPRVTFAKKIEEYVRGKVCPGCKGPLAFMRKEKARNAARCCRCDGYPFPHTKGTAPWCHDSKREPTEAEYRERSSF